MPAFIEFLQIMFLEDFNKSQGIVREMINLEFHYWNSYRNKEVKDATSLSLTSTNWEEKKGTLTLPDNCYHLEMRISAKKGSVYLDDSSLIYKGKN